VDSVWMQDAKRLEARKMLENAARRKAAVPSVQQLAPHTKCDGVHAVLGGVRDVRICAKRDLKHATTIV